VRCRVCPRNRDVDRDANPIGEARLAWFDDDEPDEDHATISEWGLEHENWSGDEREANAYEFEITMSELTAVMPVGPAFSWLDILERMNIEARLSEDRRTIIVTVVAGSDAELLTGAVVEYRRRETPRVGLLERVVVGWSTPPILEEAYDVDGHPRARYLNDSIITAEKFSDLLIRAAREPWYDAMNQHAPLIPK